MQVSSKLAGSIGSQVTGITLNVLPFTLPYESKNTCQRFARFDVVSFSGRLTPGGAEPVEVGDEHDDVVLVTLGVGRVRRHRQQPGGQRRRACEHEETSSRPGHGSPLVTRAARS